MFYSKNCEEYLENYALFSTNRNEVMHIIQIRLVHLDDDPFQAIIFMSFLHLCYLLQTKFFIIYYSIQSLILEKHT